MNRDDFAEFDVLSGNEERSVSSPTTVDAAAGSVTNDLDFDLLERTIIESADPLCLSNSVDSDGYSLLHDTSVNDLLKEVRIMVVASWIITLKD